VTVAALPSRGDSVQTWATPWHIVEAVARDSFQRDGFALDAAAEPHTAKAPAYYALATGGNGLRDPWCDVTWCNPPYENQDEWLARGAYEGERGINSAHLVLASTSSLYWRPLTFEKGTVDLYEGRIAFLGHDGVPVKGASFSSALVLYGPRFPPRVVRSRRADTGRLTGESMQLRLM
jgi:hypothetical protein